FHKLGRHSISHPSVTNDHKLVTDGPYAFVPHPGYSSFLIFFLGSVICLFADGGWMRGCGLLQTTSGQLFSSTMLRFALWAGLMFFRRAALEDEALGGKFREH
ncbi:hypothetical protein OBBRIDRAFT_861307, partial [Obba rivulosa]